MSPWEQAHLPTSVTHRDNRNKAPRESLDNTREEVGGGDRRAFNNSVETKGRSMGKEYTAGMSDKSASGSSQLQGASSGLTAGTQG